MSGSHPEISDAERRAVAAATTGGGGGPDHPVVASPLESQFLSTPATATLIEPPAGSPGVTFPEGFVAAGVAAGLKNSGRPDVGVLAVAPKWRWGATSAAVFTTNAFAAAPVVLCKTRCDLGHLAALVMNSGNANACTGPAGLTVAQSMQTVCAEALDLPPRRVGVASTGIIGVHLDAEAVSAGTAEAAAAVEPGGGPSFNLSIMTTDRFPKACAYEVDTGAGRVRLGVCAKGAGMIAPAMATMICAVTTDAVLSPEEMDSLLRGAVEASFNRVTVDGDMSTNDCVFFLSSGASGVHPEGEGLARVARALEAMLLRLALMLVADGEGATKIMRLRVVGAGAAADAAAAARAIADSLLVKTAMHGGDPNWGRIISSAGAAMAGRALPNVSLRLCGVTVAEDSTARPLSPAEQSRLEDGMMRLEIDICLDLGSGEESAELFFADLGHEYVNINAHYHT